MERTVSATEARAHFGELARRVAEQHETAIVERGGKPQLVMLSMAEYERLRKKQQEPEDWWALVQRAREQARVELGDRELLPPEEGIRQMREERDEQILR